MRTEKDVEEMGGWLDDAEAKGLEEHLEEKREELNESLAERKRRIDDRS